MNRHTATTPFGRRPVTLGLISSQMLAKEIPATAAVEKWPIFYAVRDAKEALGATDRSLAILNALLTCHRPDELSAEQSLVVYPSNKVLIDRTNGMSPATLRRHLAVLVTCGLIIRRDSPNGKRFARRGEGGTIETAYGFDLSPLLARAEEFRQLAAEAKAERKALKLVKERLTICRRDVAKMIAAGVSESVPGNWKAFQQRYEAIIGRLPRVAPRATLEAIADELEHLWADVHETLEIFINLQNMSANESHNERHIQNSTTEKNPYGESEYRSGKINEASGSAEKPDNVRSLPRRDLPLSLVLSACPEIANHAGGRPIRSWRDLQAAAEAARPYMGISPGAWQEAVEVMGGQGAAITVAAILQRSDQIKSSGGYLRNLTERARDGQFSTWPMVMALINAKMAKLEGAATVAGPDEGRDGEGNDKPTSLRISSALEKSLKGKGWQ